MNAGCSGGTISIIFPSLAVQFACGSSIDTTAKEQAPLSMSSGTVHSAPDSPAGDVTIFLFSKSCELLTFVIVKVRLPPAHRRLLTQVSTTLIRTVSPE